MKKRVIFRFSPDSVKKPLMSQLVRKYDIDVNIWNADVSYGREGKLVVELDADEDALEQGLEYARSIGVHWSPMTKELQFDRDACVHCGSCSSVCFYGALTMDRSSWELVFDPDQCVVCSLCVKACPLRLFSISREEEE